MADADSILGSISLDEIIELGNAWIRLGDDLHERRVEVKKKVDTIDMTGAAGDSMRLAWDNGVSKTIDDAAETAWTVGQTIHRYADELKKAADEYAKKVNAQMWAMILGSIFGMVFMALGPLLSGLLSAIGALLARLIPVLTQIAARIGTVGTTTIGIVGGAVSGAAINLGIDVAAGEAGAAIAGTDYDVDWGAEAWSLGLGGLVGGLGGGFAGYHYTPHPTAPTVSPKGTPPPTAPPKATPDTGGVPGAVGGGPSVTAPPRVPGGGVGGDHSFTGPGGFRGDGAPNPGSLTPPRGGGVSAHTSHPTSSGPGGGRPGDIGMPNSQTGGEGSHSAPPPGSPAGAPGKPLAHDTPVSSQSHSTPGGGRPGSGDVPTPAPPVQQRPGGSGSGGRSDAFTGPGQRLGGPQENPHGTPKPQTGDGPGNTTPTKQPAGSDPFTGPGHRLGGPQQNPHGTPTPKPGDDGPGNTPTKQSAGNDPFAGPGHRLGGPQQNPHGTPTPKPGDDGPGNTPTKQPAGNDPFAGPGQRLGGPQANPHGTPEPQRPAPAENGPKPDTNSGATKDSFSGPGQRLGGPQANPHGTPEPQPGTSPPGSHQPAPTPPAGRGHDFPATFDNRPPGTPGDGTPQGGRPPTDPFAGPGQRLGGPQADPHGTTQPRPEGAPRPGDGAPGGGGKPPVRTGTGYDRPATLDDTPGGGGRGSGSGSGGGNLRANEGSNTYVETAPTGSRPEPTPGDGGGTRTDGPASGQGQRPPEPTPGTSGNSGGPLPGSGPRPGGTNGPGHTPGTDAPKQSGSSGTTHPDPEPGNTAPPTSSGPVSPEGAPSRGSAGTGTAPGSGVGTPNTGGGRDGTPVPAQPGGTRPTTTEGTTGGNRPPAASGGPGALNSPAPESGSGSGATPSAGSTPPSPGAETPAPGTGTTGDPGPAPTSSGPVPVTPGGPTSHPTPPTESPAPGSGGSISTSSGPSSGSPRPVSSTPSAGGASNTGPDSPSSAPSSGTPDSTGQPVPNPASAEPNPAASGPATHPTPPTDETSTPVVPAPAAPGPLPGPANGTPATTSTGATGPNSMSGGPSSAPAEPAPRPTTGAPGATGPGTGSPATSPAPASGSTEPSTTPPHPITETPSTPGPLPGQPPLGQQTPVPTAPAATVPTAQPPHSGTGQGGGPTHISEGNRPQGGDTSSPAPRAQGDTGVPASNGSGTKTPPERNDTSPAPTSSGPVDPAPGEGTHPHPSGAPLDSFTSQVLAHEIRRELGRLNWTGPSITPDDAIRLHDALPPWRQRQPLRAQGDAIAQTLVGGAPFRLLGGSPTAVHSDTEMMDVDDVPASPEPASPAAHPMDGMDLDDAPTPPPAQQHDPRPAHEQLGDIAQNVMDDVRHRIRYGQANQISSVAAHGGATREMLLYSRDNVHRQPVGTFQEQLGQSAAIAEIIGTGNCGEHAAMSFALLNHAPLPPGTSIWYVDLNLRPGEDPEHPIAPYTDHVFVAVGNEHDPENIVVVDPWQIGAVPVPAGHFNFPFLVPVDGRPQITPRAERAEPDGRDYLHEGRGTIDVETLENHMDLTGPSVDPTTFQGQPGMYEHRQQYGGGLRGGSADQGVDPVAAHWPVGRPVTLAGPRTGGVTRVPVTAGTHPGAGGSSAPYTPYTLPVPEGAGASSSTQPGYEINPAGWVRLPDGTELSPLGWTSFGDDFIHTPTGALLRGDSGWIGHTANLDTVVPAWDHLDPWATPHTLTVGPDGIRMLPARPTGPAASAVDIQLVRGAEPSATGGTAPHASGASSATSSGALPPPAPSSTHPGAARFDLEAARQRLTHPATPPAWREEALSRADQLVRARIAAVAPGQDPAGVVARPDEVVQLVAAEFLRGMQLPARALTHELIRGPGLPTPETSAPQHTPAGASPLDSLGSQILAHEVRRELTRLNWSGERLTPEQLERLHDALPSWLRRQPLRARGEAIAQTLVSGAPASLPGGSRTSAWADTEMMDVDDLPPAPARGGGYDGYGYSDRFYDPRTAPPSTYRSPALREMERRSRQHRPLDETRSVGTRRAPAPVVRRESRPPRYSHSRSGRIQVVPRSPQEQLRDLGRTVIDDVRRRIRYGQANQISSVAAHGGGTREMLAYSRDNVHRRPVDTHQEWLGQSAAIAEIIGTGNCGEHAAMTFALLNRAPLPPGTSIWYVDLNLGPNEDSRAPIAPHVDHVFIAVGRRSRPEEIIVVDPWQIDAEPVSARNFNFPFLVTVDGRTRVTPRAVRFEPDGRDYLRTGRASIDVEELENHMDLTGPSVDPRELAGQRGMYEHRMQRGGLRGGSPDEGVDPLRSHWPVGRPVTLMQPRLGGTTRVPAPVAGAAGGGATGSYAPFTLPAPEGAGASSSTPPGYAINPAGWVRLPDGTELSPLGWTSFGDDFIHTPSGAFLRGDSGWIGRIANFEAIESGWDHLDPHAEPHTLVPHHDGFHLVPARPGGPATAITLVPEAEPTGEESGGAAQVSIADELDRRGLSPIHVLAGGDALADALIAAAPAESGTLVGQSRPAGTDELRSALASALSADAQRPPEQARLWPVLAAATAPDGTALLPSGEPDAVDRALADVRDSTGTRDSDWLTLALAAPVLGLRFTVLTDSGPAWTTGSENGRPVVLLHLDAPDRYTGAWAATEPTDQADGAQRPDTSGTEISSGPTWGTQRPSPALPVPPPREQPREEASPQTFFGLDPRPVSEDPTRQETPQDPVVPREEPREQTPQIPQTQQTQEIQQTEETTDDVRSTEDTQVRETTEGTQGTEGTEVTETSAGEPPFALSPYVLGYGSRFDDSVGLVGYEPVPAEALDALHRQILDDLDVATGSAAEEAAREQLATQLSASEIAQHLPNVRSARGHRVIIDIDGVEHPVDVRLRLTDPRHSARTGSHGEVPRATKLERQNEGGQSSSAAQGSGTTRTVPIPWIGIYDGPAGALRWFYGSLTLNLTHNQLNQSATVNDGVLTTTMQRANDPAHPVEFTGQWQTRVDTDRGAAPEAWGAEHTHGPLTVWFPEHRAQAPEETAEPHPEPAALDDLPLWGVDGLGEPGRLLDEVLADDTFAGLRGLSEGSREELEEFLSDRVLRGTLPMQRGRGVYSPVLTDGSGNAVGVLRLTATVRPGATQARTPEGKFALESWLAHTSGVDRSARLTSGLGLEGSGGPQFTADHAAGHPTAATRVGGGVYGKGGVAWQSTDALNTASKATLMHGLLTTGSHLLVSADVVHHVTLVRAGGGEVTGSYGPWPESGAELRLPSRETARGQAPTAAELRRLPGHLEHLEGIGFAAVPLSVRGTEALFDRAEEWLRDEGFLPPREHGLYALDEPRVQAQLTNLRRLEQLRSELGLATALPDAVEGGRPVWFELPGRLSGSRRVQLRFTAARDREPIPGTTGAPPAVHTRRLPAVESTGSSAYEAKGTRQRGTQFGGTAGFGGGPRWPLAGGAWSLDSVGDYTWGRQHGAASTAGSALGTDQVIVTSGDGTEVFAVPARFALDLYEGVEEEPSARFGARPQEDPARPAPIGLLGRPVAQNGPATVAGHITLAVPHRRTLEATAEAPAPAPRPVVRAPVTGGGAHDDVRRLELTDGAGRPLPGLTRLPDDAVVDLFRGGAALQEALRLLVRGAQPGHPQAGPLGRSLQTFTGRLPSAVTTPGTWLAEYLAGPAAANRGAFAGEALFQQTRVSSLLARAQQIFNGGYVVEGLVLPGLGADQEFQLEVTGYLHRPRGDGALQASVESDLTAKDSSARQSSRTTSHQGSGGVTALRALPVPTDGSRPPRVSQPNPSGRLTGARVDERTGERSAGTSVVRVPTESGDLHLVTADATLLVTLRQGTRNLVGNLVGLGARDGVTVAIDIPDAIRFTLSTEQLARNARWFAGAPGLPRPQLAAPTLPLPDRFVRTGELGTGAVLSVTQLTDAVRRHESRDRLRRELLALVEREAPGATRPGHIAYLPGVATRIADLTSPAALRALPGRRSMSLWFRHATARASRLVEVRVQARTEAPTPVLRQLRGRAAGEGTGLDHTTVHTPAGRSDTRGLTSTFQATAAPLSRYPRPGGVTGHRDRTGPVLSLSATRGRTVRTDVTADDRYKTRTEHVADFDGVGYVLTGSVRGTLILDWPPDLLGGVLDQGWLSLTERDGGGFAQRLGRMLRGRPAREVRVPAAVTLRFAGSEAVEPRPHTPPVQPRLTHVDPRLPAPEGPLPLGRVPFVAGPALVPTGPTPVAGFNGLQQLSEALQAVAPAASASWGLPADASPEAAAARLGELVQAGRITVDPVGAASGLTPAMPGAWPVGDGADAAPVLQVTLHNPRPVSDADDMAVDRLRLPSRTVNSSSVAGSTAGLGQQFTQSGNGRNLHLLGFTLPLLQRQPVSGTAGAAASGSQRDRVKTGAPARSDTGTNTRSYETLVDTVIAVTGPAGTRYVLGSATVRLFERDLLGHGVIGPRTASRVYDLPSLLGRQPDAALRDWLRHPVSDLPGVLAAGLDQGETSAQLWLDLGHDPAATRLARALYVGSRTAVAAGRPVELALRGATGLRFWPFTAEGRLADLTPATTATGDRLHAATVTANDASAAEADAAAHEADLRPREEAAGRELAAAQEALGGATTAHVAATTALTEARGHHGSLAARLAQAGTARAQAEEDAIRRTAEATTAADLLATAEQTAATADPEDTAPQQAVQEARLGAGIAQGVAAAAREVFERADATVKDLTTQLAAANTALTTAVDTESTTATALTRATEHRDRLHENHENLREEVRNTRQEQADQATLRQNAWASLPGLSGRLSADRCYEGTGGARFPLGSLAPGSGR